MAEVLKNANVDTLDDEHRRARLTSAGWEQTRTTLARDYRAWNAARNAVLQVDALLDAYRASKRGPAGVMGFLALLDGAREKIDEAMQALAPLGAGVVERRIWPWWPRSRPRPLTPSRQSCVPISFSCASEGGRRREGLPRVPHGGPLSLKPLHEILDIGVCLALEHKRGSSVSGSCRLRRLLYR